MKKFFFIIICLLTVSLAKAEDGSRLWLRYDKLNTAKVTGPDCKATEMLRQYYNGKQATLAIDATMPDNGGYRISGDKDNITVSAASEQGLLYGAFSLLRGDLSSSEPFFSLRLLNHWVAEVRILFAIVIVNTYFIALKAYASECRLRTAKSSKLFQHVPYVILVIIRIIRDSEHKRSLSEIWYYDIRLCTQLSHSRCKFFRKSLIKNSVIRHYGIDKNGCSLPFEIREKFIHEGKLLK